KQFHGPGNAKLALHCLRDFVPRIISNHRTLNQTVQTYDRQITLGDAWKVGSAATGENFDDYPRIRPCAVQFKYSKFAS
ncbi:hypothetical protein L218DRAFT_883038, partial [Marasmius fiardii PR-910]